MEQTPGPQAITSATDAALSTAEHPAADLGYHVAVDAFSGPLDLLLFLVRRAEVAIVDIPIALIADQFLAALATWQEMDLEVAGDFILMAATLLEIKSRQVAPPDDHDAQANDDDDANAEILDPRSQLIRQLLAYRRFKEAGQILIRIEDDQRQVHARQVHEHIPDDADEVMGIDLENCDPGLLFDHWEHLQAMINGLAPRVVLNDDVPMEVKIAQLVELIREAKEMRMSEMFARDHSPTARVGTFMATLECTRQRIISVLQHEQYGEIQVRYRAGSAGAPASETAESVDAAPEVAHATRGRRLPLITWRMAARMATDLTGAQSDEGDRNSHDAMTEVHNVPSADDKELIESDEQRFLQELEELCHVEAALRRCADLEVSFEQFVTQRRQGPAPDQGADQAASVALESLSPS